MPLLSHHPKRELHRTAARLEEHKRQHNSRTLIAIDFGWFCLTQFGVLLSWIVFRAEDLGQAGTLLANFWQLHFSLPESLPLGWALFVASPVVVMHLRTVAVERLGLPEPGTVERGLITGILLYLCLTANGVNDAFIYFQF